MYEIGDDIARGRTEGAAQRDEEIGHGSILSRTGHGRRATDYGLRTTGYRLRATGYRWFPLQYVVGLMTKQAVILARGLGTRMRRADQSASVSGAQADVAATGVKALIPIGRPFLDYVLDAVAQAGLTEIGLVIGPEHDAIRDYYRGLAPSRLRIEFIVQHEPRGTADAVLAAQPWAGREPFLVLNSDNYYPVSALAALAALDEPALVAFSRKGLLAEGQIDPARIASFAVLALEGDYLARIIEKPDPATLASLGSDLYVSMNCWRFDSDIFDACRAVPLSPRGELELPLAVQHAMTAGHMRVRAVRTDEPVLDLSSRADIASVASRLSGVEVRL
jgi:glucose-1-phosphate thymidylyltransferase